MCVPQVRANVIKAVLSYLTAFYGADATKDADYEAAVNLLREQRRLPYDGGLLNGKYKVYLACFDRMDFIHKAGAKLSVWSKGIRGLVVH